MSSSSSGEEIIYTYGGQQCSAITRSGKQCECKSYYLQDNRAYCGKHSSRDSRTTLPAGTRKIACIPDSVWEVAAENKADGIRGSVICTRMGMRRSIVEHEGFLKVFPNYRHQNRKDGFGCSSLSPMLLGPIFHFDMRATCLENFWQGSKYFPFESDSDYASRRDELFADPEGNRHKYNRGDKPKYTIFLNRHGEPQKYNYLNSRYFYCRLYELLTRNDENLQKLRNLRKKGVNLQICGYDASEILNSWESYLDTSKPFGHESVIYCLLMKKYPWNRYKEEHPEQNYP